MVSSSSLLLPLSALVAHLAVVAALPQPQGTPVDPILPIQSETLVYGTYGGGNTVAVAEKFWDGDLLAALVHNALSMDSTVAFAAPTAVFTQTTNTAGLVATTQYACPPEMLGVGGLGFGAYCCPGVWVSNNCYRTATDPLQPYTSISFRQAYVTPTNLIANPYDPNAKLSSASDLTLPFMGALAASLLGAIFVL